MMYFGVEEVGVVNRKDKSNIAIIMEKDMSIFCFKGIEVKF